MVQILNYFYHNPPLLQQNYNRKKQITDDKIIIKGAIGSGKKTFVLSYLKDEKDFLYIDELDIRFENKSYENLKNFINSNGIKTLIINEPSINKELLNSLDIKIFLLSSKKDYFVDGFKEMWLDFLDFEEFISSSNKNFSISSLFSLYILNGRMQQQPNSKFLQNHLKANYSQNAILILKQIAPNIGYQTSVLNIFNKLKQEHKISKQSVFDEIKKLENEYVLFWVEHTDKKVKKPYFLNFAIKDALSIKKDFKKTFENIVLCELLKLDSEIFYNNIFDFYLPNESLGIICEPFLDIDLAKLKIKKLENELNKVSNVVFITNNTSASFKNITISPFYEWALGL